MTTKTRERTPARPEATALRRAAYAEGQVASLKADMARSARDLADMREDRDRWREQAEKLTTALERLRAPARTESARMMASPVIVSTHETSGDLLYGVKAIADFLGIKRRQAQHLVTEKRIPTFKSGRLVCAKRSLIREWGVEQGQMTAAQEGR